MRKIAHKRGNIAKCNVSLFLSYPISLFPGSPVPRFLCSPVSRFPIRELKIDDAATPRRGVNIYDKKKDFWNLMSVTTV